MNAFISQKDNLVYPICVFIRLHTIYKLSLLLREAQDRSERRIRKAHSRRTSFLFLTDVSLRVYTFRLSICMGQGKAQVPYPCPSARCSTNPEAEKSLHPCLLYPNKAGELRSQPFLLLQRIRCRSRSPSRIQVLLFLPLRQLVNCAKPRKVKRRKGSRCQLFLRRNCIHAQER